MSLKPQQHRRPSPAEVRAINDSIRYTMWSVFQVTDSVGDEAEREALLAEAQQFFAGLAEAGWPGAGAYMGAKANIGL